MAMDSSTLSRNLEAVAGRRLDRRSRRRRRAATTHWHSPPPGGKRNEDAGDFEEAQLQLNEPSAWTIMIALHIAD